MKQCTLHIRFMKCILPSLNLTESICWKYGAFNLERERKKNKNNNENMRHASVFVCIERRIKCALINMTKNKSQTVAGRRWVKVEQTHFGNFDRIQNANARRREATVSIRSVEIDGRNVNKIYVCFDKTNSQIPQIDKLEPISVQFFSIESRTHEHC